MKSLASRVVDRCSLRHRPADSGERRGAGSGDLAAARELYASAAYDDALAVLNKLRATDHPAGQARAIEQYRAFCLLALGRAADAEQAIEAVVAAEPSYQPSDSDASPRVRSAFATVRRRMLPNIIQQQYAQAKAAFDRKEWAVAADLFKWVLDRAGRSGRRDRSEATAARRPEQLAAGFEELSAKAAAPPPPPPLPPAPAPVVAAAVVPSIPPPPRIYTVNDSNVTAPVALNQVLPAYPGQVMIPRSGRIEVVIDESGAVESAVMTGSVSTDVRPTGDRGDQELEVQAGDGRRNTREVPQDRSGHDQEDDINSYQLSALGYQLSAAFSPYLAES